MDIQDTDKFIPRTVEEFEKVYTENPNPWDQMGGKHDEYNCKARIGLNVLLQRVVGNVTEVGCGLGYALNDISWKKDRVYTGIDISTVAIEKAKILFPHLNFRVVDITKEVVKDDVIILNEVLWYVLRKIDKVLDNCVCEHLIINHGFLKEQKFDREIIDGWSGLLRYLLEKGYTVVKAEYDIGGVPLMNGLVLCEKKHSKS